MPKEKKMYLSTFRYEGKKYFAHSTKSQREADRKAAAIHAELETGSQLSSSNPAVRLTLPIAEDGTHRSITLTAKIYSHMKDDILADAAAKIEVHPTIAHFTPL